MIFDFFRILRIFSTFCSETTTFVIRVLTLKFFLHTYYFISFLCGVYVHLKLRRGNPVTVKN